MNETVLHAAERLRYALNEPPSVGLLFYDVDFHLRPDAPQP
jgi:glutamine synthetase adenylyltransferase